MVELDRGWFQQAMDELAADSRRMDRLADRVCDAWFEMMLADDSPLSDTARTELRRDGIPWDPDWRPSPGGNRRGVLYGERQTNQGENQ